MRFSYRFNQESFDKQAKFLIKLLDLKLYQAIKKYFIIEHKLANHLTYKILDEVLKVFDGSVSLKNFEGEIFTLYLCFINTQTAQILHAGGSQLYEYYANQSDTCSANKPEFKAIQVFVDEEKYYEEDLLDYPLIAVLDIIEKVIKEHPLQLSPEHYIRRIEYRLASAIFGVLDGDYHNYHIKPFMVLKMQQQSYFIAQHECLTGFSLRVSYREAYT